MCAICGFTFKDKKLINTFLNQSKHRGPDLSNYFINENITLGFNLLSINSNINSGIQPLESERYLFLFNGEIYNSKFLIQMFHLSSFKSDTIVLFELFKKIEFQITKYIEGIYAIVVYDKKNKSIYLLRDVFGSKPLYYLFKNGEFYFSSYIKNLILKIDRVDLQIDALSSYLDYGFVATDQTLYKGIKIVPKNKIIKFELISKKISEIDKTLNNREIINKAEISNEITNSFDISTKKQGLLLSGGADSNLVLNLMVNNEYKPIIFSTYFKDADDKYNSDFYYAENRAKELNLEFNPIIVEKKNIIENYEISYAVLDQPILNINMPVYYETFKQIKNHGIKSVISGDGGDEIFFGYSWHYFFFLLENFKIYEINKNFSKKKILDFYISKISKNNLKINNIFNNLNLFKSKGDNCMKNHFEYYNSLGFNFLHSCLFLKLSNDFLMLKDNLGMYFSIEARFPLIQNMILNTFKKIDLNNFFDNNINKPLLYDLFKNQIDKNIFIKSKKKGWSIPRDWLYDKNLSSFISSNVKNKKFKDLLNSYGIKIQDNLINDNIKYRVLLFSLFSCLNSKNLIN